MSANPLAGFTPYSDLRVSLDGHVATILIARPPHNYFDAPLLLGIASALEFLDTVDQCRAVILTSEGKSFCAGANFTNPESPVKPREIYKSGVRIFRTAKPIVAAVNGSAIGGGFGVALAADFRVVDATTRLVANFSKLSFHQGFGLTVTLPRVVGPQMASLLLQTSRRIEGAEAVRIGLADAFAEPGQLLAEARKLADELAAAGPLGLKAIRGTLRAGLVEAIEKAVDIEADQQEALMLTADFAEGIKATYERREPVFTLK